MNKAIILLIIALVIPSTPKALPDKPKEPRYTICEEAEKLKVPCQIMYALSGTETNHKNIKSAHGGDEIGYFQIRPYVASWLLKREVKPDELWDLKLAAKVATLKYLDCKRAFKIRARQIICYNAGPTGTWRLIRNKINLKKYKNYWNRYVKHWLIFKTV